jgi:flagellar basal-body rod protein FlgF
VGRLRLSTITSPAPLGGSRWSGKGEPATGASVVQGALEGSNADPLHGMASLIEASHFFESQQKVMQTSDEMRGRLNQIGGA